MLQSEMLDNGGKLMPLRSSIQHVWWHTNRKFWCKSWVIFKIWRPKEEVSTSHLQTLICQ